MDLSKKKRVVVKIGTSTLTHHKTGRLNIRRVEKLVKILADLQNEGKEIILVSSGAVGLGVGKLGLEEKPNKEGVEFYRNVFKELKKYNIEPLVTIWHFDTPLYLEEKLGDWKNRELIPLFVKFAKTCFEEYKGLVKYWLTFNEINNTINFLPENIDDSY